MRQTRIAKKQQAQMNRILEENEKSKLQFGSKYVMQTQFHLAM